MCNRVLPAFESDQPTGELRTVLGTAGSVRRSVGPAVGPEPGEAFSCAAALYPIQCQPGGARWAPVRFPSSAKASRDRREDVLLARIRTN